MRATLRATRFWLAGAYGEELQPGRVVVRRGRFVEAVAAHARSIGVALIVIPPDVWAVGRVATRLATVAGVNVLVTRPPGHNRALLAASDLRSAAVPVLEEAASLGAAMRSALITFHNIDPLAVMENAPFLLEQPAQAKPRPVSAWQRLDEVVRSFGGPAASAVRSQIDPVSAIVEEARERQIDMVMVGAHARSRLERLLHGSVASRVVERANCSVVVKPL